MALTGITRSPTYVRAFRPSLPESLPEFLDTELSKIEIGLQDSDRQLDDFDDRVTVTETDTSANASAITTLDDRVTITEGDISANASAITNLEATVNDPSTGVAANATAVSSLDTRVTATEGDISAQASSITTLQTDVAGNTTTITNHASSINGLEAEWGVKIDVNGRIVGRVRLDGGVDTSEFEVLASSFRVSSPTDTDGIIPFEVTGGVTYLKTAMIEDATITNAKIGSLAVDAPKIAADAVETDKLDDAAVTTPKVTDNDITVIQTTTVASVALNDLASSYTDVATVSDVEYRDAAVAGAGVLCTLSAIFSCKDDPLRLNIKLLRKPNSGSTWTTLKTWTNIFNITGVGTGTFKLPFPLQYLDDPADDDYDYKWQGIGQGEQTTDVASLLDVVASCLGAKT